MHSFTEKCVARARETYLNMCKPKGSKGAVPSRSIHRKPVWGNGQPYHGHVSSK